MYNTEFNSEQEQKTKAWAVKTKLNPHMKLKMHDVTIYYNPSSLSELKKFVMYKIIILFYLRMI